MQAFDLLQPQLSSRPAPAALLRAAVDPTVTICALLATTFWYGLPFDGPYLILSLLVFSMTFPGDPRRDEAPAYRLARDIAIEWSWIACLLLLLGWTTATLDLFSWMAIATWFVGTPALLFAVHRVTPLVLPRVLAAGGVHRTAVIVGANGSGCRLADQLAGNPLFGVRFAGFFDDRRQSRQGGENAPLLGTVEQVAAYVNRRHIDLVYIALPMAAQPRILKLVEALRDTTISIYFIPDLHVFDLIQARVETIGNVPVLAVCESPFHGISGGIKRLVDVSIASAFLLLAAPLLLAIAAAVKLESTGPAIFHQRRYGLDGREIVVYKFRSMRVREDGPSVAQATRGDPRVTRLGAILRATSLDELPQFVNVLQGRMSIVGPRPHAIAHNETYRKLIPGYMVRHKVKPGITGLAQVNGARGETDTLEKMEARIQYDLAYLRHWSLALDFRIILKTVVVVARKDNAY